YSVCSDCDDTDNQVYPGAPEICDGKVNNCDNPGDGGETTDLDLDATFDVCDDCVDLDGDGRGVTSYLANTCPVDNCPHVANPGFADLDQDGQGNACDADVDGDGVLDDDGDG